MADIVLFDHLGNPIKPDKSRLNKEIAAPGLMGVRSIWRDAVAPGLTPVALARLLESAAQGDTTAYLTLAEEMEEKDLHYASVIGTRKRAVTRLPINVEAATDKPKDVKIADAVRKLVSQTGFRGLLTDLMDGIGKGFSVVESVWNTGKTPWMPARYAWRDQRFFTFNLDNMQDIRLRDEQDPVSGIALEPYKFIVHVPKLKSGIPIRGGIAYLACWAWLFKNFAIRDWMAFLEVFGMPIRIGKYGKGAEPSEIDILKQAVAMIGVDAAAVIPDSMLIEIVEQSVKTGDNLFKTTADWFDAQLSKAVLGQTATTQGTPGKLGNDDVQNEVRQDIRDADAEQLEETINRDLVVPFVVLNFGPQEDYPLVTLKEPDTEDLKLLVEALEKLVPLGLKVEQSVVRDKLGLPDPDEDADLLAVQRTETPVQTPVKTPYRASVPPKNDDPNTNGKVAQNTETPSGQPFTPEQQALEDLADGAIKKAADGLRANEDRIMQVILNANSYEEAISGLLELFPDLSMDALTEGLERTMLNAGLFGQWTVTND